MTTCPSENCFRMPESYCPRCGHKLNAAGTTVKDGAAPVPGDFTVCLNCAFLMQFDDDLKTVPCNFFADVPPEQKQEVFNVVLAVIESRHYRGQNN